MTYWVRLDDGGAEYEVESTVAITVPDGGGGGGVPEFSDYMLILTFLIAGYAMRRRIPELQAIVAGK